MGASCLGVGRPGSGGLPPPTARPLGGLPGPTTHWLWVQRDAGVGTRHQPHSARSCELALRAVGAARGRPGGAPPAWVLGVRGRALSHSRLPALWAGCQGPLPTGCGCGGVRVCLACVRARALLGRVGRAGLPGAFWCASPFLWPFLVRSLLARPPRAGVALFVVVVGFFCLFSPSPPRCAPVVSGFACFPSPGALGLGVLSPPPPFFFPSTPSVRRVVSCFACFPAWAALGLGVLLPPPPFFFVCCRVVLCCGALSSFFAFLPAGGAGFLLFPVGSGLRAGSGSFLSLCSACAVLCWRACLVALCSLPSCPRGAGWCFVLLPVVFVCLLLGPAVLCCLLVGPGGSWCRVSVACCGVSLGAVLRRVAASCALALRCCALCCFVLLRLVLPRAVLCPGALSVVLGSCAFWRRVLSCPPAMCVFCCGVSPRGVVRRCALCRVRPGVSCCAFPVVSALCGVAVWPALPRCPAPLCCASWCCAGAWCRGVLSCRLVGFVSCVGVVVPTCKTAAKFRKIFFFPLFLAFENEIKLYTTQNTRVQQVHVRCCALRVTRRS